jgi:predicted permease
MNGLLQDLRYALRQLRKNPGFTAVAVFTLALGIGANTAVFSVMNAVLLRMLPVRDPQRLYYLQIATGNPPPGAGNTGNAGTSFSEPVFQALRQRHDVFEDVIAFVPLGIGKVAVRHGEMPEEGKGDEVSGNFFSGLSAEIYRGRGLSLQDERDHAQVVVISYDYWTRRFARDADVLGRTLFIKNVPFTIIGVAASGFRGVEAANSTDFWVPLQSRAELNAWGIPADQQTLYGTPRWWCLRLMARLRPQVTPAQAQNALQSTFGEAAKIGVGTIDLKRWKPLLAFDPAKGIEGYNQQYREQMQILMGLVLLVLVIACVNVALLLLARNEARRREFSLRLAIGGERARLFRQLFTESSLLVVAGAMLGWGFAVLATRVLADWSGIESGLDPDHTVLLFTLGISVISSLAFGLAPWWITAQLPLAGVLRATATNLTQDRRHALGGRVVMSLQVAICLLLLVAAGLLLRTLRNYETQDLGMQTDGLLVFGINPQSAHTAKESEAFFRLLLDRLRVLPGVESATIMDTRIASGWSNNNDALLDGNDLAGKFGSDAEVRSNDVGPGCFHVLGVPILQGRDISDADTAASAPVAVVNETFVKQFLPNTNPLGHKLDNKTIVGVVKDSKYTGVSEPPTPMAYYAIFQRMFAGFTMEVEVRTHGDPLSLLPTIRRAVRDIDPTIPLEKPITQQAQFEESYAQPKMFGRLGGFFGGLGALLVATGLYGTLSYRTNRRTAEIGTRMALGAQRGQVLWMVMRESLLISCLGTIVGFPLALYCARFLGSMLYQLSPFDALSFVLATCSIVIVGALAAFLPAWKAANVDPMVALRYE